MKFILSQRQTLREETKPEYCWFGVLHHEGFGVLHHEGFGVLHHEGFGVLHQLCPLQLRIYG